MNKLYQNIKLITILCIVFFSVSSVKAQIYINEFCANNNTQILDNDFFNFGDWIEIYNANSQAVDLAGYYITNSSSSKMLYKIPYGTTIAAGKTILIWADNENMSLKSLHTNFKLDATSGYIGLYSPSQVLVDEVNYGEQVGDVSRGRQPDGSNHWYYFPKPTPNSLNATQGLDNLILADKPSFSEANGFYTAGQTISITASTSNSIIRFTLDGSMPNESSAIYSQSISLSQNTVIRARVYEEDKIPSKVATCSYFVGVDKPELPVVSLSFERSYFWDNKIGFYVQGTNGKTGIETDKGNDNVPKNYNCDWKRPVYVEFYDSKTGTGFHKNADIKIHGSWIRDAVVKPMAVDIGESINYQLFSNKQFTNYQTFLLRNGGNEWNKTGLRDAIMQSIVHDAVDIDAESYRPCLLYINGEYWGVYEIREKLDKEYIQTNHAVAMDNVDLLEHEGDVVEGDATDYTNLVTYITNNDLSVQQNYEYVKSKMDIAEYTNYVITEIYSANRDWSVNTNNSVKFWRPRTTNGKWRWMPIDMDYAFYNTYAPSLSNAITNDIFLKNLLKNDEYKKYFVSTFNVYLNSVVSAKNVKTYIDNLKNTIQPYMAAHIEKWRNPKANGTTADWITATSPKYIQDHDGMGTTLTSLAQWESYFTNIYTFANLRPDVLRQELVAYFALTGTVDVSLNVNSSQAGTIIFGGVAIKESPFTSTFIKGLSSTFKAVPQSGYKFKQWSIKNVITNQVSTYSTQDVTVTLTDNTNLTAIFDEAQPTNSLYINEVLAKNETTNIDEVSNYGDWIELYNSSDNAVDIGGFYISNLPENPHLYRFPTNQPTLTTIPAKSYLLLWADANVSQGALHLNFKIDKSGAQITLTQKIGTADRTVDVVSFGKQTTDVSIGRYPDGSTTFEGFLKPTPNSTNLQTTAEPIKNVFINEFMASNKSNFLDEYNEKDDWIELYNANDFPVNVGGLFITDTLNRKTKARIPINNPSKTTIAPKGYLILWADKQVTQGTLHVDISLSADGEQLGLFQMVGKDTVAIDAITFKKQRASISYGRYPNGASTFENFKTFTPNYANIRNKLVPKLYINEFMANNFTGIADEYGTVSDWIEFYNPNDEPVDMGGLFLTDTLKREDKFMIPAGKDDSTTIAPKGYLLFWADNDKKKGVLHLSFGLAAGGEQIGLFQIIGTDTLLIDKVLFSPTPSDVSLGRNGDGGANWVSYQKPTPRRSNSSIGDGINDLLALKIAVFPNPAQEKINIVCKELNNSKVNLYIYDSKGQRVVNQYAKSIVNNSMELNTESLSNGIYLLRLESKSKQFMTKFVIQK